MMKAWRFHGCNDMRLDDIPEPVCGPGHVLVEPLCMQPSVTEAQRPSGNDDHACAVWDRASAAGLRDYGE
jgi:hypothetical protein